MAAGEFALEAAQVADDDDSIGRQLAEWGKVALIETRGRVSGRPVRVAVGFILEPSGTLLVAAGSEVADWVLNLRVEPHCTVTIGELTGHYTAEPVDDAERGPALTALILKYGTPAERLGHGPVFRLRPGDPAA